LENPFFPLNNTRFPESCCTRDTFSTSGAIVDRDRCLQADVDFFYNQGCEQQFENYFWVIGGVGLGILAVEVKCNVYFYLS